MRVKTRLSTQDTAIISCLENDADLSVVEVARRTGYRVHTVQYALQRMLDQRQLLWRPTIDVNLLGFGLYAIFFSLDRGKSDAASLTRKFMDSILVSNFARYAGEFQYSAAIIARNPGSAMREFNSICASTKATLLKKLVSSRVTYHHLPHYFPEHPKSRGEVLSYGASNTELTLSENEYRVLRALANEKFRSYRELAKKIGMLPATLDRLLRTLRERKILLSPTYLIGSEACGREAYKLLLRCRSTGYAIFPKLMRCLSTTPGVYYLIECFGDWDFEINLDVGSSGELSGVEEHLYGELGGELVEIRSLLIKTVPKFDPFPLRKEDVCR